VLLFTLRFTTDPQTVGKINSLRGKRLGTRKLRWLTNPNSDLVFYYSSYAVLQKILSSGRIRFGNMSRSNDIYERLLNGIEPSVWGGTEYEAYMDRIFCGPTAVKVPEK
jgi:hypothetical protein